jgi:dihydrofolate synthase / folylpolyglutamate synthase
MAAMTHAEAVAFIHSRVNYEVVGLPEATELRLGRMEALLERLGNPHRRYPVVHVAGTKGKGSTATMIAALLSAAGCKTGLHLSPHFERIEERMQVDGREATAEEFASLVAAVAEAANNLDAVRPSHELALTFFELTTAAAFLHFARSNVDWAVVEVGVGGRLDATNVVDPAVSVIAEIGFDHTKTLGDTIAAIAAEKAGIIKSGRPVVTSASHPDAIHVICQVARRNGSPLKNLGVDFHCKHQSLGWNGARVFVETWSRKRAFNLSLLGGHQARNAALAWSAFDVLKEIHRLSEPPEDALAKLRIPGRLEVMQRSPHLVLLDVSHNEPSAAALAEFLETVETPTGEKVLIFAASKDKNWKRMLRGLAPSFDVVIATEYQRNPRAVQSAQLERELEAIGVRSVVAKTPIAALEAGERLLTKKPDGLICVAGSFFLVAEIRPALRLRVSRDGVN